MISRRSSRFASLVSVLALPLLLTAAPVRNGAVEAELVSESAAISPGKKFTVALRMQHDAHWHSYWITPGTGYPTSLTWTLPEGFNAGEIQWPAPHVMQDAAGKVIGNGYIDEVYLLVDLTAPASLKPGTEVKLQAVAEWLMCKDVCMPGDAKLDLTLPVVANGAEKSDPRWAPILTKARADLPKSSNEWSVATNRIATGAVLKITPKAGNRHQPADLHFFSNDGLTDYTQTPAARQEGGSWVIELPFDSSADKNTAKLSGVLVSSNGWGESQGYAGLAIDVPFVSATPSSVSPSTHVAAPVAETAAPSSFLATVMLAFVGGLILNLMPCVFPVLGIKILGFVNQSGNDRKKITLHGLVFASGVLLSFWSLAGVLLVLRAGGSQLGWGFQLQSPVFVFGMAVFMLIFALNMSGLFEVGLAATGVGGNLQMKDGFSGSFFTGALATLVATPCSAPFLAPALGAALSLSPLQSLLIFTAIAVGLSLPYLLLSIFPQAIKVLPRPGAWMETFKQFMAFPLYATVGWLLWVLAGQTKDEDYALLMIAFGFVLVAMAAWAYGRFGQAHGKPTRQMIGRVCAALLLAVGLWTGWPKGAQAGQGEGGYQVAWEKWSPEAIAAAQKAGKIVYVDFTARWCATCQTNKAAIFHSNEVLAEFGKKGVVLLRGDWTNRDPKITAELARWNRSAVPFNLIYGARKSDPIVLSELLTPSQVLGALKQASD